MPVNKSMKRRLEESALRSSSLAAADLGRYVALVRKLRTKPGAQPPMLGRLSDSPSPCFSRRRLYLVCGVRFQLSGGDFGRQLKEQSVKGFLKKLNLYPVCNLLFFYRRNFRLRYSGKVKTEFFESVKPQHNPAVIRRNYWVSVLLVKFQICLKP